MIVAIHQPQYLPWMGYFHKMAKADVFCFLDNVQYKKNEWQNRNRLKTPQGWQWVTVPVHYRFPQKIDTVRIDNTTQWRRAHLQALITNYGKTRFFERYSDLFRDIYSNSWDFLSRLNMAVVEGLRAALGLTTKMVQASTLTLSDDPTQRLIDICRQLGADTYLSGPDGAAYMDLDRFRASGVNVIFSGFRHPVYPQLFGPFVANLSVVDLLFNCGPQSLDLLNGER